VTGKPVQDVVIRYETDGSTPKIVTGIINDPDEASARCRELWRKECLDRGRRVKENGDFDRAWFVGGKGTIIVPPPGEAHIKFAVVTIP